MDDLLIFLFQALFELFFEIILNFPFSSVGSSSRTLGPSPLLEHPGWISFWWLMLGCIVGGASLLVFRTTFIHVSGLRMANLIYSPFVCGVITFYIAKQKVVSNPLRRALYSFWFTLGLALVRFTYGHH